MRYIWQHIQSIIDAYDGSMPLAHFLKIYFKQQPRLGSRDRKMLNEMAYSWYRCSKGIGIRGNNLDFETKVQACLSFCNSTLFAGPMGKFLNADVSNIAFDINAIFPFDIELSDGITKEEWLSSMLVQPNLFIRVRKNKEKITSILTEQNIPFTFVTDTCISLPNSAPIDKMLTPDCYVVQDASSQQTGNYFQPDKGEQWYDCCSGAGGKSLLLKDLNDRVQLTVSDKRDSILHNLKQRFKLYGHKQPTALVLDVADKKQIQKDLSAEKFDAIICDVPCTGSGTWARTPEQLYFFKQETLTKLSALQQTITANVLPYLKPGGRLIYITCSIFKQENEAITDELLKMEGVTTEETALINGIDLHADSMFVAVLKKE